MKKINRNFPVNQQVSCCSGAKEPLFCPDSPIRRKSEAGRSVGDEDALQLASRCSQSTIFASFKPAEKASEKQAERLAVAGPPCRVSTRMGWGERQDHSGGWGRGSGEGSPNNQIHPTISSINKTPPGETSHVPNLSLLSP